MASAPSLPGFDASLRLLVERERYSLHDIGLMFGVTRERARQWCVQRGITYPAGTSRGVRALRVWNDAANRFQPVGRGVLKKFERNAERVADQASQTAARAQRQAEIVAALSAARSKLHRELSWAEIWVVIGGDPSATDNFTPRILARWDSRKRSSKSKRTEFLKATGMRPLDTRGMKPRRVKLACLRGHPRTAENMRIYHYGRGPHRVCLLCRREKDRARRRSA